MMRIPEVMVISAKACNGNLLQALNNAIRRTVCDWFLLLLLFSKVRRWLLVHRILGTVCIRCWYTGYIRWRCSECMWSIDDIAEKRFAIFMLKNTFLAWMLRWLPLAEQMSPITGDRNRKLQSNNTKTQTARQRRYPDRFHPLIYFLKINYEY